MQVYVINLERSVDRRANITKELQKTGLAYEIIPAVDGREVDLNDHSIVDPSLADVLEVSGSGVSSVLAGSVGCALSHLKIYQKIVDQGLERALVLEDDLILPADLGKLAENVADQLTGAEAGLLSYDSPTPCQLSVQGSVRLASGHVLALPVDIRQPRSTGAYVITRQACERFVTSVLPIRVQSDAWWHYYREGVLDRIRCVAPLSVLKNPKFGSTIGSYSMRSGFRAHMAGQLLRRRIPIVQQALVLRRQRIYRQWGQSELVDGPFVERPSRVD